MDYKIQIKKLPPWYTPTGRQWEVSCVGIYASPVRQLLAVRVVATWPEAIDVARSWVKAGMA